jgi:hypothetical protein
MQMELIDRLANEIGELAAKLDAGTQRLLACVRQFDEVGGWEQQGAISCAHWLAWRIGLGTGAARERVRVARALGTLPRVDEAFSRGQLSYAKVRALTRVATSETEERLLEFAHHATGAQLERICRGLRQARACAEQELDHVTPPEERSVTERPLPGGMVRVELVLSPDEAALVMKALERSADHLREQRRQQANPSRTDVPAETPNRDRADPPSRADAAVHVAHSFLACGCGDARCTGGDRYQLLVHLDQDVLAADGQWAATLDDGSRVSAETLRRLACDTALVTSLTDGNGGAGVLDVGRRTRSIPSAIRRALWVRDRGCRFPGCPHTRFLHGHHIRHWFHGGPTSLTNLVLLCPRHHTMVHEGGFTIEVGADGALVFRSPRKTPLPFSPPRANVEDAALALRQWATEQDIEIGPDTNLPWWDGAAVPDYDWAISSLLQ